MWNNPLKWQGCLSELGIANHYRKGCPCGLHASLVNRPHNTYIPYVPVTVMLALAGGLPGILGPTDVVTKA